MSHSVHQPTTIVQLLTQRAALHPERRAASFWDGESVIAAVTYRELHERAACVAARLATIGPPGQRALLLFPPGIDFLSGFFGCAYAGWIPVPTCFPKPGRSMPRLDSAARNCAPAALIADQTTLNGIQRDRLDPAARDLPSVATDSLNEILPIAPIDADPESLALLQYTSGSTSEPKGVMVRHRNLIANLAAIQSGFQLPWQPEVDDGKTSLKGVFWLPAFHDMGLVGGLLAPLYMGGETLLMAPQTFLRRPLAWLQAISDHAATISGAPNFAYSLCADRITPSQTEGLNLSAWQAAFCGAEPISKRTLDSFATRFESIGFSSAAFYPCYGLAEATLLVAGGAGPAVPSALHVASGALRAGKIEITKEPHDGSTQAFVSCGRAVTDTELRIVDPSRRQMLPEDSIGEIWLRGRSIAAGYWNQPSGEDSPFGVSLANDAGAGDFLRTGDLGFLHDGELYVTGRLKDVVILRGRNHYPQDIEATVQEVVGPRAGQAAAFAVDSPRGEALAIIAEVDRHLSAKQLAELVPVIRRSVIEQHEVDPRHVLLTRPATIPLTSSGKVQRYNCRQMFNSQAVHTLFAWHRGGGAEATPLPMPALPAEPTVADRPFITETISAWLLEWMVARGGVLPADVAADKPFAEFGLDSLTTVELSGEIEDWAGVQLDPLTAWNHPTPAALAGYIAEEILVTKAYAAGSTMHSAE